MIKERKSNRLKGYDYSSDNLYFVTSCVHNRVCCFGEIIPINPVVGTGRDPSLQNDDKISVGTGRDPSLQRDLSLQQPKIKSLSELMGAYKTTVSKQIHLAGFMEFQWQRSFYEHIIRNEKSYKTISDYIFNNPKKWEQDKFYKL